MQIFNTQKKNICTFFSCSLDNSSLPIFSVQLVDEVSFKKREKKIKQMPRYKFIIQFRNESKKRKIEKPAKRMNSYFTCITAFHLHISLVLLLFFNTSCVVIVLLVSYYFRNQCVLRLYYDYHSSRFSNVPTRLVLLLLLL